MKRSRGVVLAAVAVCVLLIGWLGFRWLESDLTSGRRDDTGKPPIADVLEGRVANEDRLAAEPLIRIVDAYAENAKRGLERLDPLMEIITPEMQRADGPVEMAQHHAGMGIAPVLGGTDPESS